jgi:Ca2+-binding RTX toxin-like protein
MRATKRAILIGAMVLGVLQAAAVARAAEPSWTVLLVGGPGDDSFHVGLSDDGRTYEIGSAAPLEVGGSVCRHPGGDPLALRCDAPSIAGFEVLGEAGNDSVQIDPAVTVPATLSGGDGDDSLIGGAGNDKVSGGDGTDRLSGGPGDDEIAGGNGPDGIAGDLGDDKLGGEGGADVLAGGDGSDALFGGVRSDRLFGGPGDDRVNGGGGRDFLYGGPGDDRFKANGDVVVGGPGRDFATPGGLVS